MLLSLFDIHGGAQNKMTDKNDQKKLIILILVRDEIKSSGKFAIRSSFKIAQTPSLPLSILNTEFPHPNLLNNTSYNVSR